MLTLIQYFSDVIGGSKPTFGDKVFGDLLHVLMTNSGYGRYFDIFRKYLAEEVAIFRDTKDRYTEAKDP